MLKSIPKTSTISINDIIYDPYDNENQISGMMKWLTKSFYFF